MGRQGSTARGILAAWTATAGFTNDGWTYMSGQGQSVGSYYKYISLAEVKGTAWIMAAMADGSDDIHIMQGKISDGVKNSDGDYTSLGSMSWYYNDSTDIGEHRQRDDNGQMLTCDTKNVYIHINADNSNKLQARVCTYNANGAPTVNSAVDITTTPYNDME